MAQVTDPPPILIVAHGSPSHPETQETVIGALAQQVGTYLPDWRIEGVTLAAPGAFERAVERLAHPLIYPFFMADGFFIQKILADRTAPYGLRILPPFGLDPDLPEMVQHRLSNCLISARWQAQDTTLLLAAHGGKNSGRNADSTDRMKQHLLRTQKFRDIRTGFVEQKPALNIEARIDGQAICLPFFALRAGHYEEDVLGQLAHDRFAGPILPPFIEWGETPSLIANGLTRINSKAI